MGTHLRGVSALFVGWFGPRGLASLVLGLIVVAEAPLFAGRGTIEQVVALTVLFSVLLHGITAAPLSAAYARRVEKMAPMRRRRRKRSRCQPARVQRRPFLEVANETAQDSEVQDAQDTRISVVDRSSAAGGSHPGER